MSIPIPDYAAQALHILEGAGFSAWVVGGCVRDSLLGLAPHDWDICTDALPDQVMRCFSGMPVIPTGLAHGTVTAVLGGTPCEITTLRTDGRYSDYRRPDSVRFVRRIEEDLARRDFTVNAMAYHPRTGICDPFNGYDDLQKGTLRAVGEASKRFHEDALRILRALRFASAYCFRIDGTTAQAIHHDAHLLRRIAAERLFSELCRLLTGADVQNVLLEYPDVCGIFLPEILPCAGFAQKNPHHIYDVWDHTAAAVAAAPPKLAVRLALLFHDLGKPACFSEDKDGTGHFYGHAEESVRICHAALIRLRAPVVLRRQAVQLVKYHDLPLSSDPKWIRRWLNKLGQETLSALPEVQRADTMAQAPQFRAQRIAENEVFSDALQQVLEEGQCFTRKQLAVDGHTLMACLGLPPGKKIGALLDKLLQSVLDGKLQNTREALLEAAHQIASRPE